MIRQFTATCYILKKERFLLLKHPKYGRLLPPGGHLEPNETPPEAVRREVLEETGLEIKFLTQENIWMEDWNGKSIERPYSILLCNVPEINKEPAHQHINFIYVAEPVRGDLTDGLWYTIEQIEQLIPHEQVFTDTQQTARQILAQRSLIKR